uniref:Aminotransferase-like plant mobile domain-containing protein n=1 Tax=Fagus sylvatica TaxID=28930 RepID=A0A2N9I2P9_FAGSY
MLPANREFHVVAGVVIFPTHPGLCESELGFARYGSANRGRRGVFGPSEDNFPIRIPVRPSKILAIREFHVVHGCVFFPTHPGSRINLLRSSRCRISTILISSESLRYLLFNGTSLHRAELGFTRYGLANRGRRNVPYAKGVLALGPSCSVSERIFAQTLPPKWAVLSTTPTKYLAKGGQFEPVFGQRRAMVRSNLGQWSCVNLVKLGMFGTERVLVGLLKRLGQTLGQTKGLGSSSQTWSTLVKLGQKTFAQTLPPKWAVLSTTSTKLGVFRGDEPSSEQCRTVFSQFWPQLSCFLCRFRPVKYEIEAFDILYMHWSRGGQFDPVFGLENPMVRSNLGQTWSNLVKFGQSSPNSWKCIPDLISRVSRHDPRRRNPRKSLVNIDSLREVWESEICTDDDAQPRSAPLLLRYVVQTKSFLACRLVKDIQATRANPANLALPPVDIRKVLDEDTPDMAGINLRNLLPTLSRKGTSERPCRSQSTPARSKRARVESSAGPSRPATSAQPGPVRQPQRPQGAVQVTQLANIVRSGETDCILPVGVDRSATVASALSQAVSASLWTWRSGGRLLMTTELISNLRRGLLMGARESKLLWSWRTDFGPTKDHLAHANVLATNEALDSLTKAEDKVRALELELERAKKEAYESGSKDAQDEMGRQLPGLCNLYYMDAWDDALAVLNSRQTTLPSQPLKQPFPQTALSWSRPPPAPEAPEAVLNSPLPQLGDVVDLEEVESAEAAGGRLEEVESAEAAGPAHDEPMGGDAPDGGSAAAR